MGQREQCLEALRAEGTRCDDCLAELTGIQPRQTINARCRDLAEEGLVRRETGLCPRCRSEKLVNALTGAASLAVDGGGAGPGGQAHSSGGR